MSAQRRDVLVAMRREPPPPLPPTPEWQSLKRSKFPVSKLINYTDEDGRSCWREPWPGES